MNNKLTTRDFITIAFFNILIIFGAMISSLFTPFVGYAAVQIVCAILMTPFLIILAIKVKKRGVFLLTGICQGLFYMAMGMTYYILIYLVFTIIAEIICWKTESYNSIWKVTVGTALFQIGYYLGGVVPLFLFRGKYLAALGSSYSDEKALNDMLYYYEDPVMISVMILLTVIGVIISSFIAKSILNRHIKKAKHV